ncbi:O-antigen ligase family protein [Paenibacillus alginolyticus]|uniref:O-antigen ligase-related domain-containing protein n=1 Tax=Paenibacillus alginolyticus TaxID=59839 RepID=A0ABT4G8R7_9BACL|nr:O-antigen ligase family protein [Paenibacillus alginolyticus]MCY9692563.1 hypothetical protein [Paenibacillus alginolyticus]MEC0143769.1 hypothetical protein [Paenibacillus alginolyticus]
MQPVRLTSGHYIIIFFYAFTPFLYFLKPFEMSYPIISILLRIAEPLLILCLGVLLLRRFIRISKFKFDVYLICLILFSIYGVILGFIMNNEPRYIISGFVHILTGLLCYSYFKYEGAGEPVFALFMRHMVYITVPFYVFAIGFLYVSNKFLGTSYYIGLDCPILLLALFWFLQQKKAVYMLLIAGLIFLSGKRGILLVGILGTVFATFTYPFSKSLLYIRSALIVAVGIVVLQFSGVNVIDQISNSKVYEKVTSAANNDINFYSAGRLEEITSALDEWTSNPAKITFGSGLGFSYTFKYEDYSLPDDEDYHNIHFSPLNILLIWGAPISILLALLLATKFWELRGSLSGVLGIGRLTVISLLAYSCFVFNIFQEPMLWTLVGMFSALKNTASRVGIST